MDNFRNIAIPVIIILTVSALIAVLFLPLANTDWAEGMRTDTNNKETQEDGKARADMPAAFGWIMPFVKIGIFMIIPGLLTLGIRRLIKGKPKSGSAATA